MKDVPEEAGPQSGQQSGPQSGPLSGQARAGLRARDQRWLTPSLVARASTGKT